MPKITKPRLLGIREGADLGRLIFPKSEGYQYKRAPGIHGEIIVIIDDDGTEAHIWNVDTHPRKTDYTKIGDWPAKTRYKFILRPKHHLLLIGKDINDLGQIRFNHIRIPWNSDGVSRSFVQTLNKLGYGQYAAFEDLFERKEVTEKFYDEFILEINELAKGITGVGTLPEARRMAFTIAERLLFLHFVQTKGMLDGQRDYLLQLVQSQPTSTYKSTLKSLFFDCLNVEGLNKDVFGRIPYLNGGLFRPTEVELANPAHDVTDDTIRRFVAFLGGGRWNWHLDERTDVDEQNTLDPALLGHIFEKTVNQKEAGAYYTPRPVAKYMAEQAILGYLGSRCNPRVAAASLREHLEALDYRSRLNFARDELSKITILDNACGSGAFLLAAMDVLLSVWEFLLGPHTNDEFLALFAPAKQQHEQWRYHLVKWIISHNLFGVDIEAGAIEIAKLRLWLALAVEVPEDLEKVEPLPNIDYNLRRGNSLVGFIHQPREVTTLLTLETDLSQLLVHLPAALARDESTWRQGELFSRSLQKRERLVQDFRSEKNATKAATLKHAIDAFDDAVRESVEGLWEKRLLEKIPDSAWITEYRRLRDIEIHPLHWWFEFPTMMAEGGPSVIITNPPWEKARAELREFHTQWWPDFLDETKYRTENLEKHLGALYAAYPDARDAWGRHQELHKFYREYFKRGRFWRKQGKGDTNLYKLFLEHYLELARPGGWIVPIVGSRGGFYTDAGCRDLREAYWKETHWLELLAFENSWPVFDHVHRSFKISILIAQNGGQTASLACFFMAHEPDSPYTKDRVLLDWEIISSIYPDTLAFPEVSGPDALAVMQKMTKFPLFTNDGAWNIDWMREIDRSGDRSLFQVEPTDVYLVEGATFHQFDSSFAKPETYLDPDKLDAHILAKTGSSQQLKSPRLVFREVAGNTDARTLIVARIPTGPSVAHTAWTEKVGSSDPDSQDLLLGVLNSIVVDWQIRRLAGAHVTKSIIQSIRIPDPMGFATPSEEIRALVQRLEATAGAYNSDRARLDALVAHAFGLTKQDLTTIWSDFHALQNSYPGYINQVLQAFDDLRSMSETKSRTK